MMQLNTADPRQCSFAEHSGRKGLRGLRVFGAGILPVSEVRQISGSATPIEKCELPEGQ
jgi:hypothetical protein